MNHRKNLWLVGSVALFARVVIVLWAWSAFPPTADGTYYHQIAKRIAEGHGYTWLWPDGVVTYAAHYPIGYPALISIGYWLLGPRPWVAMCLNATLGIVSAIVACQIGNHFRHQVGLVSGVLVAIHPGLVFYTPALMTEGVTAVLLLIAVWSLFHSGSLEPRRMILFGVILGLTTLVRPQSILLAPFLVIAASGGLSWKRRLGFAVLATLVAIIVCLPWTVRNCVHMNRCALVSVNGGWNLLIGTDLSAHGSWAPIEVPSECKHVFDEAGKDDCFGKSALAKIVAQPFQWLSLAPKKMSVTFDYSGAAAWYLHASNPDVFTDHFKTILGIVETIFQRLLLLVVALDFVIDRRRHSLLGERSGSFAQRWMTSVLRMTGGSFLIAGIIAIVFLFTRYAFVSYGLIALLLMWSREKGQAANRMVGTAIVVTMLTHAVFFGAGRYSLVVFPLICVVASTSFDRVWLFLRSLQRYASY